MHFKTSGFPQAVEEQWDLTAARVGEWVQNELFDIKWWVLFALFIFTAYLWWKRVDKTRLGEMLLHTSIVIILIIVLDELGEELSLWYYNVDIIPLFPPMTAMNMSCLPFVYMLVYQHTKTWKSFTIATVVMAIIFVFAIEPVFQLAGIYSNLNWESYYGLPVYIFIAVASRAAMRLIGRITSKKQQQSSGV